MTGWIVLRTTRTGFEKVTQIDAVSATHAIESAVTEPGEYCAVKERDLKVFRVGQVQAFRVLPEIELAEASATG